MGIPLGPAPTVSWEQFWKWLSDEQKVWCKRNNIGCNIVWWDEAKDLRPSVWQRLVTHLRRPR